MIDKLFYLLDNWRNLPDYQLERRADIFFAMYLEQIIEKTIGVKIDFKIPEFPVRKDTSNRSNKIDYLAYSKKSSKVFLIELKTDLLSVNDTQIEYLIKAKNKGIGNLVKDVDDISKVSKAKVKYENLKKELKDIDLTDNSIDSEILFILPKKSDKIDSTIQQITFDDIIEALKDSEDHVAKRFSKSLELWKKDPNKKQG